MSLEYLPEELLVIILQHLDTKSVHNLFNAGNRRIQDILCSGVIKRCDLSLSSLATVHTLKTDFFKGISKYIKELNLSAIQDLTNDLLLPVMNEFVNLVNLDVAYTSITIFEFLDIYKLCPEIKNISIDFKFHEPCLESFPQDSTLAECQEVFSNFENVHFVGSADNLLGSYLPMHILQKSELISLTYTIAKVEKLSTYHRAYKRVKTNPVNFQHFRINMVFCRPCWPLKETCWETFSMQVLQKLYFEIEFIHIIGNRILCSPIFENILTKVFNRDVFINQRFASSHTSSPLKENSVILIWNKEATRFDYAFFCELEIKLKPLLFSPVTYTHGTPRPIPTRKNSRIKIVQSVPFIDGGETLSAKKKRVPLLNLIMDYDNLLNDIQKVKLSILFWDLANPLFPVTLPENSNYLKKLTFLQLQGPVQYDDDFFYALFRSCENLITFDVNASPPISSSILNISEAIPLSRSVKNVRISNSYIMNLNALFNALAQCKQLETIVLDKSSEFTNHTVGNLHYLDTLLKNCENLYYFYIFGTMKQAVRKNIISILYSNKKKYKRLHLYTEVVTDEIYPKYTFDPFAQIFKLSAVN